MLKCCRSLGLASALSLAAAITGAAKSTLAQIVPDQTLGTESSRVTSIPGTPGGIQIDGGATRGTNLFHSFSQFSVPTNGSAQFNNALNIQNIFTRVTGTSVSTIDGLIHAYGTANLFLINPNGITFGPNASLKIGGSFVASTASSLKFADGSEFSATAPHAPPLLSINVPIGLQFGANPGNIINQSQVQVAGSDGKPTTVGLQVIPGKTLALVGGDVYLNGGYLTTDGYFTALGGRIELGSVAGPGLVSLTPIDKGWSLGYEGVSKFGQIQLSNAGVDANGAGGGDIQVQGSQVLLTNESFMRANTNSSQAGGTLNITASNLVQLSGGSFINARTFGAGSGGNLTITTGDLLVSDGSEVDTDRLLSGQGEGGNLSVSASGTVQVDGPKSYLRAENLKPGASGNLTITTGKLLITNGGNIETNVYESKGQAGGQGGSIYVNASDSVQLAGSNSSLQARTYADGAGGSLTINTKNLLLSNNADIDTLTFGRGHGGNLSVMASDSIQLIGLSNLNSGTHGPSVSGDATINTNKLIVQGGSEIFSSTFAQGNAGNLLVTASEVDLTGDNNGKPSALLAEANNAGKTGALGGNLTVITGKLHLSNGAEISTTTFGQGNGNRESGNLSIKADFVELDGTGQYNPQRTALAAENYGTGFNGGNITLEVQKLLLLRSAGNVSATAITNGNGGNIRITTPLLVAIPSEGSTISANAEQGNGGNVTIDTAGIFGFQFQKFGTLESDITASSKFGINGVVNINTPNIDPSHGVIALPAQVVDRSALIAQGCGTGGENHTNQFIVTGRGGLPPNPSELFSSDAVLEDTRLPTTVNQHHLQAATSKLSPPAIAIVPASGWVFNHKGEVTLTASASREIPRLAPAACRAQ